MVAAAVEDVGGGEIARLIVAAVPGVAAGLLGTTGLTLVVVVVVVVAVVVVGAGVETACFVGRNRGGAPCCGGGCDCDSSCGFGGDTATFAGRVGR